MIRSRDNREASITRKGEEGETPGDTREAERSKNKMGEKLSTRPSGLLRQNADIGYFEQTWTRHKGRNTHTHAWVANHRTIMTHAVAASEPHREVGPVEKMVRIDGSDVGKFSKLLRIK